MEKSAWCLIDVADARYDEIEMLEPLPTATEAVFYPQTAAAWGWEQGTTNEPAWRSRLLGECGCRSAADV